MNYSDIKDFSERCETHPDHQDGIVSNLMLVQRMHEEIEELRAYIEGKENKADNDAREMMKFYEDRIAHLDESLVKSMDMNRVLMGKL